MNAIDKFVEYFAPTVALKRHQSRMALDIVNKRAYEGASKGRRTSDWRATGASANMEVHTALSWLRNRSRQLVRDNAYAKNAVRIVANNTVGTGIIPTPEYENNTNKKKADGINEKLKSEWKSWASKIHCDVAGELNLYGIQHLAMKATAESGGCIIRQVFTANPNIPVKVQILEDDYIDTFKHDLTFDSTGLRNYYGIQFNRKGEKVGYWIYKMHPVEFGILESVFVPAEQIIYLYEMERPGQIRGIPFSASSMLMTRDLSKYEDAELMRQIVASCFTTFITKDTADDSGGEKDDDRLEKLEPGIIEHLQPGESVTFANPPLTQGYDSYTKTLKQGIAAGNGITYESMTGDLSNVNFSSYRAGWIDSRKNFSHWQWNMIVPKMCDRLYEWFLQGCVLKGIIQAGLEVSVSWTTPKYDMLDPLKEGKAREISVRGGFKSWSETVKEDGYNPEDVLRELKADQKLFEDAGLLPTSNSKFDAIRQLPNIESKKVDKS